MNAMYVIDGWSFVPPKKKIVGHLSKLGERDWEVYESLSPVGFDMLYYGDRMTRARANIIEKQNAGYMIPDNLQLSSLYDSGYLEKNGRYWVNERDTIIVRDGGVRVIPNLVFDSGVTINGYGRSTDKCMLVLVKAGR